MAARPGAGDLCDSACKPDSVTSAGAAKSRRRKTAPRACFARGDGMSTLMATFRAELRRIVSLRPVFSVIVLAAVVYAFFYPQPYLNEALRNVPIAVVDLDGTQSSRDLARLVDATPDVSVAMVLPDVGTAEREVYARRIFGILVIPQYFERDLLHGRPSPIAL